jgi:hypothetical protein
MRESKIKKLKLRDMFTIRNSQLEDFREAALQSFEDEMVEHIKEFFPNHFMAMQQTGTRATIRYGYEKAKSYGFTTKRNVCLYLNIMLLLGSNFDIDPQYPLAKSILTAQSEPNPNLRMDELSDKVLETMELVAGPGNMNLFRAILNFNKKADEIFQSLIFDNLNEAHHHLNVLFAQKYQAIGVANLQKMINLGSRNAAAYGLVSESGVLIYVVFMFMLGSGFDKDPQFPWAGDILNGAVYENERKKIEALYYKAIDNLRVALSQYKK